MGEQRASARGQTPTPARWEGSAASHRRVGRSHDDQSTWVGDLQRAGSVAQPSIEARNADGKQRAGVLGAGRSRPATRVHRLAACADVDALACFCSSCLMQMQKAAIEAVREAFSESKVQKVRARAART